MTAATRIDRATSRIAGYRWSHASEARNEPVYPRTYGIATAKGGVGLDHQGIYLGSLVRPGLKRSHGSQRRARQSCPSVLRVVFWLALSRRFRVGRLIPRRRAIAPWETPVCRRRCRSDSANGFARSTRKLWSIHLSTCEHPCVGRNRERKQGLSESIVEPIRRASYVALAGEFFVLGELALRGLDGTLTFGHTKEIDILVLNRRTNGMLKLEVKTTHKSVQHSGIFGPSYAWLMDERHAEVAADNLIYCFVLIRERHEGARFFLVPSRDVATYIGWEHPYWQEQSTRRTGQTTRVRTFRIPIGEPLLEQIPPSWADGRWRRFEDHWEIFGALPDW
jgi:hypothetical protein